MKQWYRKNSSLVPRTENLGPQIREEGAPGEVFTPCGNYLQTHSFTKQHCADVTLALVILPDTLLLADKYPIYHTQSNTEESQESPAGKPSIRALIKDDGYMMIHNR